MNQNEWFLPLLSEDIEEKISINLEQHGYSLLTLKKLLEKELFMIERFILEKTSDGETVDIKSLVQRQNLREQISYVTNNMIERLQNGSIPSINHSVHNKDK